VAPLAVTRLGLLGWTEVCGVLTVICIGLAVILRISSTPVSTEKA